MKKSTSKLVVIGLLLSSFIVVLTGCSQGYTGGSAGAQSNQASGPTSGSNIIYHPRPLNPAATDSGVSLATADLAQVYNGNFAYKNMSFMAYQLDGKYFVRADICPPCGSRSFTLNKGKLICDSCGTVFNATTGLGVSGACVAYAKKPVTFNTDGNNLVMTADALTTAYQNTINRRN